MCRCPKGARRLPAVLRDVGFDALWHPELLLAAVLLAIAYLQLTGPLVGLLRERLPAARPLPRRQRAAFVAGLAALYLAGGSPLELLGNRYLLSAHMGQAVLVAFWAPPLLIAGTPEWLLRPLLRVSWLGAAVRKLTRPAMAVPLFAGVFSCYLLPSIVEASLANPWLYLLERVLMVGTAFVVWWPLTSPLAEFPRIPEPVQLLYTFVIELGMTVAFGLVTFAPVPLYPTYAHNAPLIGVTAMTDQQVAGILMRVGSMVSFGIAFARATAAWMRRDQESFPA